MFDRHTYEKGSLVLHTLRNLLGDEVFRRGINLYLTRHAHAMPIRRTLGRLLRRFQGNHSIGSSCSSYTRRVTQ
ncbi:M1 family aminopeptidase [Vulcanisaeta sp. JCM 14467]|uniref:M1 family aminopeptidase n=1 Tax=Vulcanisaeta sp. JCM 14467 TaxID=1295370 RepID=UPI0031839912